MIGPTNQRTLRWAAAVIGFALLLPLSNAGAEGPERWIESAISSYGLGMESKQRNERLRHFAESERFFRAAIENGAGSADTWANLGNAALQAERLGPAILAYRRALVLAPDHTRASQNLVHARGLLPEWLPVPSEGGVLDSFFFWRQSLSDSARAQGAAACFALAALALAIAISTRLVFARYLGALFGLLWLGMLGSDLLYSGSKGIGEAVVIVPEVVGRAADSINAPVRFGESLPSGTEVRILEDRGGWLHIELHNGRDAWLVESAVEPVEELSP